jgi:hypothetical protein
MPLESKTPHFIVSKKKGLLKIKEVGLSLPSIND